jgi:hypothetical protein
MIQSMRLLLVTGISVGMVACHSNPNSSTVKTTDTTPVVAKADTAGLAAFKAAKQARYEDSLKNVGAAREREISQTKTTYAATRPRTAYRSSGYKSSNAASGYASTAYPAAKKKSHAARNGALIGAGAGAITGALVSKKKGVGALIGGVAGGAAGYGVGKIIQNKKEKDQ